MHYFLYRNNELWCEDVPVKAIAQEVGTPFYLYSARTFKRHFNAYKEAFGKRSHLIAYAVKSNSNLAVLNLLGKLGAGADIVSGGELFRALKADIPAGRIVYSGVGKTMDEISAALEAGILLFNVESTAELEAISSVARQKGKRASISFRVNPDVDPKTHPYISTGLSKNKFGLSIEQAMDAYERAATDSSLEVKGIDCHIGSQLTDIAPFRDAFDRVKRLVDQLENKGIRLEYIDIGGGLGIQYNDETPPLPSDYARPILEAMDGMDHTLIVEPGRSISGNAGILVTRVLYTKKTPNREFYVVDAAMNDLARPSLYQAYHEINPVEKRDAGTATVDIVGPICETGDFLARDRVIQVLEQGELLAVMSAGAYGFTMSSNYNSRPRAAEVMVNGDTFHVVRERETYDDLIRGECMMGAG